MATTDSIITRPLADYEPAVVACSTLHSWEHERRGVIIEHTYRLDHADERCPLALAADGIGTEQLADHEPWPCAECFVDNPGRVARDAAGPNGSRVDSIDAPERSGNGGPSAPAPAPSEKSLRFLTALVRGSVAATAEWVDGTLSADDAEGVVEGVVSVCTTQQLVSAGIDRLLGSKVEPVWDALSAPCRERREAVAAPAAERPARTNRYAATCADCGSEVPADTGSLTKSATGWQVRHVGGCPERAAAPTADGYVPVEDDVHVVGDDYYRVHISQTSGRPYAAVWNGEKFVGPRYDDRARGALRLLSSATLATAEQAAAFGRANRRCCFCSHKIDTPESKAVGYGPDCARKHDLPWGA